MEIPIEFVASRGRGVSEGLRTAGDGEGESEGGGGSEVGEIKGTAEVGC